MDEHNSDIEQNSAGSGNSENHLDSLRSTDPSRKKIDAMSFPILEEIEESKPESVDTSVAPIEPVIEPVEHSQAVTSVETEGLSRFTQWLLTRVSGAGTGAEAGAGAGTGAEAETEVEVEAEVEGDVKPAAKKKDKGKKSKKKKKKGKKKDKTGKSTDSGVLLSDSVVSETLAKILEKQGHYDQAIAMYEKLGLKYPEKSRFFADRIEKLRSLNG